MRLIEPLPSMRAPFKEIYDSLGFGIPRRGFRYWIPVFVSGTWMIRIPTVREIPDFFRVIRIPHKSFPESGCHRKKISRLRQNPDTRTDDFLKLILSLSFLRMPDLRDHQPLSQEAL